MTDSMNIIKNMPKVELHVHLEGSVQPATLFRLAERNKIELPVSNPDDLKSLFAFEDFNKFVEIYMTICECIRTADDVFTVAWEFFQEQNRHNIIYCEATWTAYTHLIQYGLSFDAQAEALFAASDKAEKELGLRGLYVFDIPRQVSPEEGLVTAAWLADNYNPDYIAAIGLGGPEVGFPPERHAESFKITGERGIPAVPHAGETAGADSIRGALALPGTMRIGHGVRAVEDPLLIEELKQKNIVLEVCPTSNLCLKVFSELAEHSLPKLIEAGVGVTINSDDPPMFSTNLTEEYLKITEAFGFDLSQLRQFNETAIGAALCPEKFRGKLHKKFDAQWKSLGEQSKK